MRNPTIAILILTLAPHAGCGGVHDAADAPAASAPVHDEGLTKAEAKKPAPSIDPDYVPVNGDDAILAQPTPFIIDPFDYDKAFAYMRLGQPGTPPPPVMKKVHWIQSGADVRVLMVMDQAACDRMNEVGAMKAKAVPGYDPASDPKVRFIRPYAKVELDMFDARRYGLARDQRMGYVPIDCVIRHRR